MDKEYSSSQSLGVKDTVTRKFVLLSATLRDLPAMREMEKICFPLDAWPLIEQIAALTFPGVLHIKAVVGERMVGFIGGDVRRSQGFGWITTLSVLPEFRRLGIANALLDACEREMAQPVVRLCVRRSNLAAQALYLKRGYTQSEVWEKYYQGGEDALVLEKHQYNLKA